MVLGVEKSVEDPDQFRAPKKRKQDTTPAEFNGSPQTVPGDLRYSKRVILGFAANIWRRRPLT
jgi:hypothetical protein